MLATFDNMPKILSHSFHTLRWAKLSFLDKKVMEKIHEKYQPLPLLKKHPLLLSCTRLKSNLTKMSHLPIKHSQQPCKLTILEYNEIHNSYGNFFFLL